MPTDVPPDPADPISWEKVRGRKVGPPALGQVNRTRVLAGELQKFGERARAIRAQIVAVMNTADDSMFAGAAADALRAKVDHRLQEHIEDVARAFETAATALNGWADTLAELKQRANRAHAAAEPLAEDDPQLLEHRREVEQVAADHKAAAGVAAGAIRSVSHIRMPISKCEVFWEAFKWLAIALIVPAILIGGAFGILAFGVNLALFLKTAVDVARGKAGWLEMFLATLGIIAPSTRGLPVFGAVKAGWNGAMRGLVAGSHAAMQGWRNLFSKGYWMTTILPGMRDFARLALTFVRQGALWVPQALHALPGVFQRGGLAVVQGIRAFPAIVRGVPAAIGRGISTTWSGVKIVGSFARHTLGGWRWLRLILPVAGHEIRQFGLVSAANLSIFGRGVMHSHFFDGSLKGSFFGVSHGVGHSVPGDAGMRPFSLNGGPVDLAAALRMPDLNLNGIGAIGDRTGFGFQAGRHIDALGSPASQLNGLRMDGIGALPGRADGSLGVSVTPTLHPSGLYVPASAGSPAAAHSVNVTAGTPVAGGAHSALAALQAPPPGAVHVGDLLVPGNSAGAAHAGNTVLTGTPAPGASVTGNLLVPGPQAPGVGAHTVLTGPQVPHAGATGVRDLSVAGPAPAGTTAGVHPPVTGVSQVHSGSGSATSAFDLLATGGRPMPENPVSPNTAAAIADHTTNALKAKHTGLHLDELVHQPGSLRPGAVPEGGVPGSVAPTAAVSDATRLTGDAGAAAPVARAAALDLLDTGAGARPAAGNQALAGVPGKGGAGDGVQGAPVRADVDGQGAQGPQSVPHGAADPASAAGEAGQAAVRLDDAALPGAGHGTAGGPGEDVFAGGRVFDASVAEGVVVPAGGVGPGRAGDDSVPSGLRPDAGPRPAWQSKADRWDDFTREHGAFHAKVLGAEWRLWLRGEEELDAAWQKGYEKFGAGDELFFGKTLPQDGHAVAEARRGWREDITRAFKDEIDRSGVVTSEAHHRIVVEAMEDAYKYLIRAEQRERFIARFTEAVDAYRSSRPGDVGRSLPPFEAVSSRYRFDSDLQLYVKDDAAVPGTGSGPGGRPVRAGDEDAVAVDHFRDKSGDFNVLEQYFLGKLDEFDRAFDGFLRDRNAGDHLPAPVMRQIDNVLSDIVTDLERVAIREHDIQPVRTEFEREVQRLTATEDVLKKSDDLKSFNAPGRVLQEFQRDLRARHEGPAPRIDAAEWTENWQQAALDALKGAQQRVGREHFLHTRLRIEAGFAEGVLSAPGGPSGSWGHLSAGPQQRLSVDDALARLGNDGRQRVVAEHLDAVRREYLDTVRKSPALYFSERSPGRPYAQAVELWAEVSDRLRATLPDRIVHQAELNTVMDDAARDSHPLAGQPNDPIRAEQRDRFVARFKEAVAEYKSGTGDPGRSLPPFEAVPSRYRFDSDLQLYVKDDAAVPGRGSGPDGRPVRAGDEDAVTVDHFRDKSGDFNALEQYFITKMEEFDRAFDGFSRDRHVGDFPMRQSDHVLADVFTDLERVAIRERDVKQITEAFDGELQRITATEHDLKNWENLKLYAKDPEYTLAEPGERRILNEFERDLRVKYEELATRSDRRLWDDELATETDRVLWADQWQQVAQDALKSAKGRVAHEDFIQIRLLHEKDFAEDVLSGPGGPSGSWESLPAGQQQHLTVLDALARLGDDGRQRVVAEYLDAVRKDAGRYFTEQHLGDPAADGAARAPWEEVRDRLRLTLPDRIAHESHLHNVVDDAARDFNRLVGHPADIRTLHVPDETVGKLADDFRTERVTAYDALFAPQGHKTDVWLAHEAHHTDGFRSTFDELRTWKYRPEQPAQPEPDLHNALSTAPESPGRAEGADPSPSPSPVGEHEAAPTPASGSSDGLADLGTHTPARGLPDAGDHVQALLSRETAGRPGVVSETPFTARTPESRVETVLRQTVDSDRFKALVEAHLPRRGTDVPLTRGDVVAAYQEVRATYGDVRLDGLRERFQAEVVARHLRGERLDDFLTTVQVNNLARYTFGPAEVEQARTRLEQDPVFTDASGWVQALRIAVHLSSSLDELAKTTRSLMPDQYRYELETTEVQRVDRSLAERFGTSYTGLPVIYQAAGIASELGQQSRPPAAEVTAQPVQIGPQAGPRQADGPAEPAAVTGLRPEVAVAAPEAVATGVSALGRDQGHAHAAVDAGAALTDARNAWDDALSDFASAEHRHLDGVGGSAHADGSGLAQAWNRFVRADLEQALAEEQWSEVSDGAPLPQVAEVEARYGVLPGGSRVSHWLKNLLRHHRAAPDAAPEGVVLSASPVPAAGHVVISAEKAHEILGREVRVLIPTSRDLTVAYWLQHPNRAEAMFTTDMDALNKAYATAADDRLITALDVRVASLTDDLDLFRSLQARQVWNTVRIPQIAALVMAERRGLQSLALDRAELVSKLRSGEWPWAKGYLLGGGIDGVLHSLVDRVILHLRNDLSLTVNVRLDKPVDAKGTVTVVEQMLKDHKVLLRNIWESPFGADRGRGPAEEALGYPATVKRTVQGSGIYQGRTGKADELFAPTEPSDLPKYAALTSPHRPQGVELYGNAVFHLKHGLMERASYTPSDSFSSGPRGAEGVTGLGNLVPLLNHGDQSLVRLAFAEATDFAFDPLYRALRDSGRLPSRLQGFFEAQIHGEVAWQDLDRVVLFHDAQSAKSSQMALDHKKQFEDFADRHGFSFTVDTAPLVHTTRLPMAPVTAPDPDLHESFADLGFTAKLLDEDGVPMAHRMDEAAAAMAAASRVDAKGTFGLTGPQRSEALRSFQRAWAKSPAEAPSEGELGNPVHVALLRAYALVGRFQRFPFGGMAARLEEHAGNFHMLSPADQDVVVVADFLRRQPTAHPDEAVRLARELSRGKPTPDAKALAGSPTFTGFQGLPDLVSPAQSGSQTVPAAVQAVWVEGRPVDFLNPARFREQTADPSVLHPRSRS
ncbi:hypothetical protein ACWCPF_10480, partial [Streptomyces sp. NPDC001858]